MLDNLAHRLESAHPVAAGSLREGLEETLTVMRLELPETLERVLSSTNLIENLFSRVRDTARQAKRWQGGMMILRRTAAAALEAEGHFNKIAGHRALPKLLAALRAPRCCNRSRPWASRPKESSLNHYQPLLNFHQRTGHHLRTASQDTSEG